jgi:putative PEP-CTERM system histidine kinase
LVITFSSVLYALVAVVYTALAGWRLSISRARRIPTHLAIGLGGMAAWSLATLFGGGPGSLVGEAIRNVAWCAYLAVIVRDDRSLLSQAWIGRVPAMLIALAVIPLPFLLVPAPIDTWMLVVILVGALTFCIGALTLLYSLFHAAHHAASGFKLVLFALAVLWAYDLNAYAAALLRFDVGIELTDGRTLVALLLAPLLGIAARRKENWSLSPSRKLTFQSLSLVAIGSYFVLLSTIAGARPWLGGTVQAVGGTALVIVVFGAIFAFLASARVRAQIRVYLSKHLFKHRYDYRVEWLRFNATINSGSLTGLSPEQRAIKALADIMDATGGLLYLCSAHHRLERVAEFEWLDRLPIDSDVIVLESARDTAQVESQIMIAPRYRDREDTTPFPTGLPTDGSIWLAVPLVRIGSLVGIVALGRPRFARRLDWEDFDLLKVLGQQIATYVADARGQAELEEARQFEEFNRRFAFIVHDIKNVVSQLSLVTANAEVHGANPRFQVDMMSTLRNSIGKMTTLLSRLSLDRPAPEIALHAFDAMALLRQIADARRSQHPVSVAAGDPVWVRADPAKLETAIDHLVQNAIEASGPEDQVVLSAHARDGHGVVSVLDNGGGMSADFIRRRLFKPFASTKPQGFGIGAGEAQSLVRQMGGDLEVQSVAGVGTSFIITLALGTAHRESVVGG